MQPRALTDVEERGNFQRRDSCRDAWGVGVGGRRSGGERRCEVEDGISVMASALCFMLYGCSLYPHVTPYARGPLSLSLSLFLSIAGAADDRRQIRFSPVVYPPGERSRLYIK